MQHDHVLKKIILTPAQGLVGGRRGSAGKIFAITFPHSDSILFDMQSENVLKKLNFDLLTPGSGDGGEQGCVDKIFATMLLHSCFPLI